MVLNLTTEKLLVLAVLKWGFELFNSNLESELAVSFYDKHLGVLDGVTRCSFFADIAIQL